jgi:D-alanine transaminase
VSEIYLNGAFVPAEAAKVSVFDRGFLFGDGVYEVIPAYGGRPLRLAEHLLRLGNSLRGIGMQEPLEHDQWASIFEQLLAKAPGVDQALYVQVTRGAPPVRDHRFPDDVPPTVLALAKVLKPRDPVIAEVGVAAILRDDIRWSRCDIKSISLLAAVLLREEADEADAEEALLVRDGHVVEGSTSNLFICRAGRIVTPPKGTMLLPGVTRDLVLDLARGAGLPVDERPIRPDALTAADEVWITSSTREVVPVTRVDGAPIGDGTPGPIWRQVDGLYQDCKADLRGYRV